MTRETQHELYQALEAHTSELEITRGAASGPDLEVLDRRIEAARLLLEWLSQALEPPLRVLQQLKLKLIRIKFRRRHAAETPDPVFGLVEAHKSRWRAS
jgi:hypothetical protein